MKKLKLILFLIPLLGIILINFKEANAVNADTAMLRIIATGDLHGQVTAYNYETNSAVKNRGLSKLSNLINDKRNEVGIDNALLVDAGAFLYDYSSNYFYDKDKNLVQPIMKAMNAMGYDYITLGNHEFDYPFDYLNSQLMQSGLSDKVVLCNAVWHDSGEPVFAPSAIITKTLTTKNNKTFSVRIGIIGSTTNSISARRGDYVNVIDALNNYDSILAEANRLSLSFLPNDIYGSIKEVSDYKTGKNITLAYIKRLSAFGPLKTSADHNWKLTAGKAYRFLFGVPKKIKAVVTNFSWNTRFAADTTSYSFFEGKLPKDAQTMNIAAVQGRTESNNQPVPIRIQATSAYSIKEIHILSGKVSDLTNIKWTQSELVHNNTFYAAKNGIYTILAIDSKGNRCLSYVTVDRYDEKLLPSPLLNRVTNRNSSITGSALPNSILHMAIGEDTYIGEVTGNGTFTINIKPPKAFSTISFYIESNGKKSVKVKATVRKTGPNAVLLNPLRINDSYVSGTADANAAIYALIWKTVYVGRGQTNLYKHSEYYKPEYNIVKTDITLDKGAGTFKISLPSLKANMKVFVFSVDRFGVTSKSTMQTPL